MECITIRDLVVLVVLCPSLLFLLLQMLPHLTNFLLPLASLHPNTPFPSPPNFPPLMCPSPIFSHLPSESPHITTPIMSLHLSSIPQSGISKDTQLNKHLLFNESVSLGCLEELLILIIMSRVTASAPHPQEVSISSSKKVGFVNQSSLQRSNLY